jgi:choline dehydrogenase-like flavoprotein
VCIVGGGPAGIALALDLAADPNVHVSLLESGGTEFEASAQDLTRGEIVGAEAPPLHEVLIRALGGSTWSWGGVCTPLEATSFETRSWVPATWPIDNATLEPYLEKALDLCGITPRQRVEVDRATDAAMAYAHFDGEALELAKVYFGRPLRFGMAYRETLERAPNISVHVHSTVTSLEVEDGRVAAVAGIARNGPFRVEAKEYVLAGGGIGNPRLLMLAGLGGDAVGRYFMDHPRVVDRFRVRSGDTRLARVVGRGPMGTLRFARLTLTDAVQRAEQLVNWHANLAFGYAGQDQPTWVPVRRMAIALRKPWNESPYYQDAGGGPLRLRADDVAAALRRPHVAGLAALGAVTQHPRLRRFIDAWSSVEQLPDPENRVELLPQRDRLGVPLVRLHWRIGAAEEHTYRRAREYMLKYLEALEPGISGAQMGPADPWPATLVTTWHHLGTTRMSAAPSGGAVDADCQVHGVVNLHVAGGSVFPTSGSTAPTITIIQLALRLGRRLAARLQEQAEVTAPARPARATRRRTVSGGRSGAGHRPG